MVFGAALLRAVLEEHLPSDATGLLVALSGGADSAALLTALKQGAGWPLALRAVHVDHGLQRASLALKEASEKLCRRLAVPLSVLEVRVDTGTGVSIEAEARRARYRALALELRPGECLLTAHHAQDQAETLLLQLMRGAGVAGLSAMPVCRPFAKGWHLRPLLNVTPRELGAFRASHAVLAVEDPMNRDPRFDRAYLRLRLWPAVEERWPAAAETLSRAARHLAEAQESLDSRAEERVDRLRDGDALSVRGLRALSAIERVETLRHWLRAAAITPPPASRLTEALKQILQSRSDHQPAIVWGPHALRRYRQRLFVTPAIVPALAHALEWRVAQGSCLPLGESLGTLRWASQPGGLDPRLLPDSLSVRRRRGGETLRIGARARTQSVQHLCQSMGVLPWMRDALPMLYAGDALVGVADLWQDAHFSVARDAPGIACVWEDAPILT